MNNKLFHIYLFIFGFLYYLILPLVIAITHTFATYPGMHHIHSYYNSEWVPYYLIFTLFLLFSFIAGSLLPLKYLNISPTANTKKIDYIIGNRDLFLISIPFFLFGQYSIISNSNNLFKGYQTDYNTEFMGTIATLNTLFLFFLLYNQGKEKQFNNSKIFNLYLSFSIFEFSIILLGLGSRMYILVPLISYVLFLLDNNKINLKKLFLRGSIAILGLLGVGVWRLGDSDFSFDALLYIGIAEPVFTWISAESIFASGNLPLISIPTNFITSFFNFIPSILLPDKADLIQPISLSYDSPLGATNILVSLIDNFGILGSCFALFILGFFFTTIRINLKNVFYKTYYYCACGIIPFQLFRDEVSIVNKMLFYNFLLFPLIFLLIERFISYKYQKHNENNIR